MTVTDAAVLLAICGRRARRRLDAQSQAKLTFPRVGNQSFQQPTFQKFTWNQLGIYLQMPCLYLRQYNTSYVSSQILKCRLLK